MHGLGRINYDICSQLIIALFTVFGEKCFELNIFNADECQLIMGCYTICVGECHGPLITSNQGM